MSNPLREAILRDIVEPAVKAANNTVLARVREYDKKSEKVSVVPLNFSTSVQTGDSSIVDETIDDISILNTEAIKSEALKDGDLVYLSFVNNDYSKGVILSILKDMHSNVNDTGKTEEQTIWSKLGNIFSQA